MKTVYVAELSGINPDALLSTLNGLTPLAKFTIIDTPSVQSSGKLNYALIWSLADAHGIDRTSLYHAIRKYNGPQPAPSDSAQPESGDKKSLDEMPEEIRAELINTELRNIKDEPAAMKQKLSMAEENAQLRQQLAAAHDETAWLVEAQGPVYLGVQADGILGWTGSHAGAIRFSRREDAQRYIDLEGLTGAIAVEHMWCGDPVRKTHQPPANATSAQHELNGLDPGCRYAGPCDYKYGATQPSVEGQSLPRYGIKWQGEHQPIAVEMPDGYWTPWHLAMGHDSILPVATAAPAPAAASVAHGMPLNPDDYSHPMDKEMASRLSEYLAKPHPEAGALTGLPIEQEPKYTTDGRSIINRVSGEAIPHDEPIFIFRARDIYAHEVLCRYLEMLPAGDHVAAVTKRLSQFYRFAQDNPARMKEPDTALLTNTEAAEGREG